MREAPGRPDDSGRTDGELLRDAAEGDREAVGELFGRHRDRLWAVAVRTLGDREEAADALQDAFVSVLRTTSAGGSAAFRGDSAPSTWLHRVVVNACLDRARRRAVRPADPFPDAEPPARGPDAFSGVETALDLERALDVLPLDQRAALVLVHMYGWSVEDAAEVLDCQPGTVKSRCSRGRARLVTVLGAAGGNRDTSDGVPSQTVPTDPASAANGGDPTP
ncbi:MAG: polymerase sigma-70 factor, subfamily [Actinomycetota bacterium]|nr:polymerase sigma-70 factor, subfamily [Actinomycetota bacterium]